MKSRGRAGEQLRSLSPSREKKKKKFNIAVELLPHLELRPRPDKYFNSIQKFFVRFDIFGGQACITLDPPHPPHPSLFPHLTPTPQSEEGGGLDLISGREAACLPAPCHPGS